MLTCVQSPLPTVPCGVKRWELSGFSWVVEGVLLSSTIGEDSWGCNPVSDWVLAVRPLAVNFDTFFKKKTEFY